MAVLLAVEVIVDKVPAADHVNDVVNTIVRPTAGALLMVAVSGNAEGVRPGACSIGRGHPRRRRRARREGDGAPGRQRHHGGHRARRS